MDLKKNKITKQKNMFESPYSYYHASLSLLFCIMINFIQIPQ